MQAKICLVSSAKLWVKIRRKQGDKLNLICAICGYSSVVTVSVAAEGGLI